MELDEVPVIVTGAASGLGEAVARQLSGQGARVAVLDRDRSRGPRVADSIGGAFLACDVGSHDSAVAAIEEARAIHGPARVLVCAAGIGAGRQVVRRRQPHDLGLFEEVVRVNLIGTFNLARLAAFDMSGLEPDAEGERGVIVTVSSIAAFDGVDGGVAYSASKAGVAGMTLPLARDLAPHGIRVVSVAPGSFDTPMVEAMPAAYRSQLENETPFPPRFGRPTELAELVGHVIGNRMINGETIRIDGGLRMRPSWQR